MSRVLIPSSAMWFEELKAVGYYGESDLEREIRQHVGSLFPDFFVFPFKQGVSRKGTSEVKKPDLAMVRHDILAWGIIEVELSDHGLEHVLEQTSCFAEGDYNAPEIAVYIRRQLKDHCRKPVALDRLTKLIGTEAPSILVIADAHNDAWEEPLESTGVGHCIFQIFKNFDGHYLQDDR